MKLSKKLCMLGLAGYLGTGFGIVAYADAASDTANMYYRIIEREEATIKESTEALPGMREELAELQAEYAEMDARCKELLSQNKYDGMDIDFDWDAFNELKDKIRWTESKIRSYEGDISHAHEVIADAKESINHQLDYTFISRYYERQDDDTFSNGKGEEISNLTQRIILRYNEGRWELAVPYRAWSKYGPTGGNWDYTGYAGISSKMEITLDGNPLERDPDSDTEFAYFWKVDFDIEPNTVYDMTINDRSYTIKSDFADYDGDGYRDLNGYNPALDNPYSYENTYGKYNTGAVYSDTDSTDADTDTDTDSDIDIDMDTDVDIDTDIDTDIDIDTDMDNDTDIDADMDTDVDANTGSTENTAASSAVNTGLGTYLVLTGSDYVTSVEDNTGVWEAQSDGKWKYKKSNGAYANNEFVKINGVWYAFSMGSIMESDIWLRFDYPTGATYFCQSNGAMAVGWCLIGDSWYYFNPDTSLIRSAATPDGYMVDENGKCVQ